jgi:hypothetical protein
MRSLIRIGLSVMFVSLSCAVAFASEPPPPPPPPPKPAKPSGLTGNTLPQCESGTYPAGNICKPAPPGYYVPSGTKYPQRCPPGTISPYGARGPGECKPE